MMGHTDRSGVGSMMLTTIFMIILIEAAAFSWPAKSATPAIQLDINHDTDLMALMRPMPQEEPEIYAQALQILSAMQDSPSCNRLAVSTLLTSCQAVEGSMSGAEVSFDEVRSLYAAQLAVCELAGAGSTVPTQCKSLTPVQQTGEEKFRGSGDTKRLRPGSPEFNKFDLNKCLQLLESRPQWWTSYSNSRQNAGIMCRAARSDVDKEDLIKLHKAMVETSSAASSALSQALRQANHYMLQQQDLAKTVKKFHENLLQGLQKSSAEAQSYFSTLMKNVDSVTQTMTSKITYALRNVEHRLAGLGESIQNANSEIIDLEKNVGEVFQQVVQGSAELASSQTGHWDLNRRMAIELQNSLENMHGQLVNSNKLIATIHFRQTALEERLDNAFGRLEHKVNLQAEAQSSLHDQMQLEMQVARGLIADITSSATNLKNAVEDTSSKIAQMASISGVTDSIMRWVWMVLIIFVLYQLNPRIAGYLATAFGAFLLLMTYGIFDKIVSLLPDFVSGYDIESIYVSPYVLLAAVAGIGVVAILVIILHRFRKAPVDVSSKLPFLETRGIGISQRRNSERTF